MLFLLLGNLFSWSALKQQQTEVNTPSCIKFALRVDSPCPAEVPLLCHPLWEMVRDSQDGLQAARIRWALPETPSCAILRNSTCAARQTLSRTGKCWALLWAHYTSWCRVWGQVRNQLKQTPITAPLESLVKWMMPLSSYEVIPSSLQESLNVSAGSSLQMM